jgi:hypothetical protein
MLSWPSKFGSLLIPLTRSVSTDPIPLPTLRRDTGQVIIFPSDISMNTNAYISYPVPLVHLGLITYILCSELKWQSSSLHTTLSRLSPLTSSILSQKQTSQQHTVSAQSLPTRFPLIFCWGRGGVDNSNTSSYEVKKEYNLISTPHTCLQRTATAQM